MDKKIAVEVKKAPNTAQKSKKVSYSTNYNKHFLDLLFLQQKNPPKATTSQSLKAAVMGNKGSSKKSNK